MAAYNAIPDLGNSQLPGGAVYFPPGRYLTSQKISVTSTKPVAFHGAGRGVSIIQPYPFTNDDGILVNGPAFFTMANLTVGLGDTRDRTTYLVNIRNCLVATVTDVHLYASTGNLLQFDTCSSFGVHGLTGSSNNGTAGDTAIRIKASGGVLSDCQVSTGTSTGYSNTKPTVYVTGQSNSIEFSNCTFGGVGPRATVAVSSVASDASKFTVTTAAAHGYRAGDIAVIKGASVSGYNNTWRVATVPTSTTFTVTSTLNPGAASAQGTVQTVAATVLISNEAGAVNEMSFTGCLFAGNQAQEYGSASVHIDGRLDAGNGYSITGLTFTGCYYDSGAYGFLVGGNTIGSSSTVSGITVVGGTCNNITRQVQIESSVTSVVVSDLSPSSVTPSDDGVSSSAAVYIWAGVETLKPRGITLRGAFGTTRNSSGTPYVYGVALDDTASASAPQDITIVGCELFGSTAPWNITGGIGTSGRRYRVESNRVSFGALPQTNTNYLPSVASATSIDLTAFPYDTIKITGTTNIQTIVGGWIGRRTTLICTGALQFATGGNMAVTANYSVLAGQTVSIVCDGTNWYVK